MTPRASIRTHLLQIVLLGAILPLAIIGIWMTRSAVRSGRALLDEQLAGSVQNVARIIDKKWMDCRATLLLLADNQVTRDALVRGSFTSDDSTYLAGGAGALGTTLAGFAYRNRSGSVVYSAVMAVPTSRQDSLLAASRARGHGTFHVSFPVGESVQSLGTLDADVLIDALLPVDSARVLLPNSSLAVRDRPSGTDLVPLARSAPFPATRSAVVDGKDWLVRVDTLAEPALDLAVGAPLAPYTAPFARDGIISLMALIVVAFVAILLTRYFTSRLAGSVDALVETAGAVAGGDLSRQVHDGGPAELQRLAESFNTMTESLRGTLAELSERRALSAVGEFAAALAHEVRNALTSIQLDLERMDERSEDSKNRVLLERSLVHVRRLDAAVTGSLRIARSGRNEFVPVAIADVIRRTVEAAEPSFVSAGIRVMTDAADANATLPGDAEALHQMFLNLLLNAQQAMEHGGLVTIAMQLSDQRVVITITDTGRGMTGDEIAHAFEPYFTTRTKGTGLGLPIARMIVEAHGGEIRLASEGGRGTTVTVNLPQARQPGRGYQPRARS